MKSAITILITLSGGQFPTKYFQCSVLKKEISSTHCNTISSHFTPKRYFLFWDCNDCTHVRTRMYLNWANVSFRTYNAYRPYKVFHRHVFPISIYILKYQMREGFSNIHDASECAPSLSCRGPSASFDPTFGCSFLFTLEEK